MGRPRQWSSSLKARFSLAAAGAALALAAAPASAGLLDERSDRLLLTGGVSTVEGAGGGGLSPWALIAGYGTRDQVGGGSFFTYVNTPDFNLRSFGGNIGIKNRLELSVARQNFDLEKVGGALGLGNGFTINQTVLGAKVRLFGDAVLEQDSWLPQVAVGVQHKINDEAALVRSLGARSGNGTDFYISATKIFLSQSLLFNTTLRFTKANQFGILGFGGRDDKYRVRPEGSVALLLTRKLAVGAEIRFKTDNLAVAEEDGAYDIFVAYAPAKNVSLTVAYADLGNIVVGAQRSAYASLTVGF